MGTDHGEAHDSRGACRGRCPGRDRRGGPAGRVAGVIRMTTDGELLEEPTNGSFPPDGVPGASDDEVAAEEPAREEDVPAGELTETQLEALLFVAERPLSRREIGVLAGVDRATVDERLGDLEVALAGRGIRLLLSGD